MMWCRKRLTGKFFGYKLLCSLSQVFPLDLADKSAFPVSHVTLGVERHGRSLWLCAVGHAESIKLARFSSWREVDEFQRALHLRDMMMHEKGRMGF